MRRLTIGPRNLHTMRSGAYRDVVLGDVRRTESGQAVVDYTLIVAAIAVGCVLAILFLSGAIHGLFDSTGTRIHQAPLEPPRSSSELTWPTSVEDCEDGGWQDFPQFADEAACLEYVDSLTP
jgi:Flp pilus assembly pilin Flp